MRFTVAPVPCRPMHIFLTGASSGIGAAVARAYGRSGPHRFTLLARREAELEALATELRAVQQEAFVAPCDVTDAVAVQQVVDAAEARFGPIDVVFANAGIGEPASAKRLKAHEVARTMRVNFEGCTNVFCAVLPSMLARGQGHIAAVSSIAGFRGLPGSGPYCASKAALSMMLESMRFELVPLGIAVTTVHPGFVTTPMTARNRFPMPFLWSAERAAAYIVTRMPRRPREINFPWPMVLVMRLARLIPNAIYDRIMGGRSGWKA